MDKIIIYKDSFRDAIYGLSEENADICIIKDSNIICQGLQLPLQLQGINYSFDILTNIKYKPYITNKSTLPISLTSNMILNGFFNINGNCDNMSTLNLLDILTADIVFLRPKIKKLLKTLPVNYNIQHMNFDSVIDWLTIFEENEFPIH